MTAARALRITVRIVPPTGRTRPDAADEDLNALNAPDIGPTRACIRASHIPFAIYSGSDGRRPDEPMIDDQEQRWSPADHPYAIAVSQSQWALWAAQLFARDAKQNLGDTRSQIYARQIFGQLRALQRCAEMMAGELERLGVPEAHRDDLDRAIGEFEAAVPGAKSARDILEHFDDYARGQGKLVKQAISDLGIGLHQAAALHWGGGYDPDTEEVTEGPFVIVIPAALESAGRLQRAIYAAGRAVDRHRTSP